MKDSIVQQVLEFLAAHYQSGRPVLLGFSGGPDSTALLYLFLEARKKFPDMDLHLAHVDHLWRPESSEEAAQLRRLAKSLNLPFHEEVFSKDKDLCSEAGARKARLQFFKTLYEKYPFQALVFGHQQDDQAETVLKRFFEGANLSYLGGMRPASRIDGMAIWRPLLTISKKNLLVWLQQKKISFIDDPTNRQVQFLRARMRVQILPELAAQFGKEISGNLCALADDSAELQAYLHKRIEPFFSHVREGAFGTFMDFNALFSNERIEIKTFLKKFSNENAFLLSREQIQLLTDLILSKAANRSLSVKNRILYVDRGVVFLLKDSLPRFSLRGEARSQRIREQGWEWDIDCRPIGENCSSTQWQDLFNGEVKAVLPEGNYELIPAQPHFLFPGHAPIKNWWGAHKIPAFLRSVLPLIAIDGKIVHEFLTGKTLIEAAKPSQILTIKCKSINML